MTTSAAGAAPPRLCIQLVLWNSATVVEAAFESLDAQTCDDFEVVVVDNASADDSAERAARWLARTRRRGSVVRSPDNLGFCGGHNLAFRASRAEWVLQLNPDAVLPPTFVADALATADRLPPDVGTIAPLILLPDGMVDSTGLFMDRYRRLYDRGQGTPPDAFTAEEDVPACTGAVALHRRAMLDDICADGGEPGHPFDERLLWMYYDDYDVGLRAWRRGWRVRYVPSLVAHHGRAGRNALRRLPARSRRSVEQTMMVRNRFLMMAKCDRPADVVRSLPWLVPFELARLAYLAVRAPHTLRGYPQALALLPAALRARRRLRPGSAVAPWRTA